jgi:AcrR family transcriptional regulator
MSREQDILDAAIKIFSEKGFSAATTSEIAKEAGVAEGTIFRYFKTKKDILKSVMVKLVEVMSEELVIKQIGKIINENKDKEPAVLLKLLIKDRIQMITKYQGLVKIVFTEIQYHEDLKKTFIQSFALKAKEIINAFYSENVNKGIFKDYDPSLVLRSFVGMVLMFAVQRELAPDLVQIDEDKQIDMMVDMILYGISNNGGNKNV